MATLKEIVVERLHQLSVGPVEAAVAAGIERTFIRDIVEDKKKSVRADKLLSLAKALFLDPEALARGELIPLDDEVGPRRQLMSPILGKAGAGPDGSVLFATGDGNFGEVPAPEGATANTSALEVQGDSMRGLANDGWLIFYEEKESPRPEHMGEPCVCFLEDDRVLIKTPWPGSEPGLFHLESFNAPLMRDVPVRYFAFVTDIKPRRSAQKFIHRNPDAQVSDVTTNGHKRAS